MTFYINNNNFLDKNSGINYITFWVKGIDNKDIEISLKGNYSNYQNDYQKHTKYNVYVIKTTNLKYFEFEITIKGKPGDLITIGNFACSQNCNIDYFYSGQEFFLILIKGIGVHCFLEELIKNNDYEFSAYEDNLYKQINYYGSLSCAYNPIKGKTECEPYLCLEIPSSFNELLYTLKSDRSYFPQSNNDIVENKYKLHHLSYGLNYSMILEQNESIRLFPLYFDNFNYLTYNIKTEQINNVSIFNCDNYPLCILSPNDNSKNTPIQRTYGSYSFSFHKYDIPNRSPIGKNQKLLMITCYNSTLRNNYCQNLVRVYTDKSVLFLTSSRSNEYKILREGNTDRSAIYDLTYVSTETLSGKISTDYDNNTTEHYSKNNINSFIVKKDSAQNKIILFLTIKGEKDSVYSIKNHRETITKTTNIGTINDIYFSVGGNSLFKLQQNETVKAFILSFQSNHFSLINVYPIGCSIDFKNASVDWNNYTLYPIYKYDEDEDYNEFLNNTSRKIWIKPSKETCFIFSSFFILNNSVYDNGIVLEDNSTHTILFSDFYKVDINELNELKYIYYFVTLDNKIKIKVYHIDQPFEKIIIFINDNIIKKFNYNNIIELNKNDWENICKNSQQICKLTIILKLEYTGHRFISISISSELDNYSEKEEENENKHEKEDNILIVILPIIGIILFIIFLIYRYKKIKKMKVKLK